MAPNLTRGKAMPVKDRAAYIERALIEGSTAAEIVTDLGIKAGSVVRALERADRRDLIPEFDRLRKVDLGRYAA